MFKKLAQDSIQKPIQLFAVALSALVAVGIRVVIVPLVVIIVIFARRVPQKHVFVDVKDHTVRLALRTTLLLLLLLFLLLRVFGLTLLSGLAGVGRGRCWCLFVGK